MSLEEKPAGGEVSPNSSSTKKTTVYPAITEYVPLDDLDKAAFEEGLNSTKTVRASESYEDAIDRPGKAEEK